MPSQRAILIDLAKKKLNPAISHKTLDKSGHLRQFAQQLVVQEPITSFDDEIVDVEESIQIIDTQLVEEPNLIVEELNVVIDQIIEVQSCVEEETKEQPQIVEEEKQPYQKRRGRKFSTHA